VRIAAAALGVLSIWWVLWRTIEAEPPRDPRAGEEELAPGVEKDGEPPNPALGADARESLGHPEIAPVPPPPPPEPEVLVQIAGIVTDAVSHAPVKGAKLRFVDAGWEDRGGMTDVAGAYAVEHLAPGRWEVVVQDPAHRTLRATVEIAAEPSEQTFDLVLVPGDVIGVKVEGGVDLERVRFPLRSRSGPRDEGVWLDPCVMREEPGRWLAGEAESAAARAGRFHRRPSREPVLLARVELDDSAHPAIPDGCFGVFVLTEPAPVFACLVFRDLVLQTRAVPPGASEVVFALSPEDLKGLVGAARLRVVDGDSELPPRGLQVKLDTGEHDWRQRQTEDGTVTIEKVLPGRTLLTITADDREPVVEGVLVEPGQVTDLGLYRLERLSSIRGRVVDDEGRPAQVSFNVFPLDRYAETRSTLELRYFRSNAEGELKIDSVGRHRHLILANEKGWVSMPALADTTLGDVKDLTIRASPGVPVAVRLRAEPLPGTRLEIRTRSGLPVVERKCRDRDPMQFLLVPGNYSVELWDGETWLASESLTVGAEPVRMYFPR
jgi:hypothetical protein